MAGLSLLPIFLVGLLGSVHCVGMCGGIVGALSLAGARAGAGTGTTSSPATAVAFARSIPGRPVAVPLVAVPAAAPAFSLSLQAVLRVLAYNSGRIASYAAAGALAGGLAGGVHTLAGLEGLRVAGYWLANLMLIALGLTLMEAWRGVARLETAGNLLWRRVQPWTRRVLPVDRPGKMLVAGLLWGWLPCGMVYSMLMTAVLAGSAGGGAAVMVAFGLGTLPMLLGLGLAGQRLRRALQRPAVRRAGGAVVLAFGVLGVWRAAFGLPASWLDALCLTPGGVH